TTNIPENMGVGRHITGPNEKVKQDIKLHRQRIAELPRHETGITIEKQARDLTPEEIRLGTEGPINLQRAGNGFYINKIVYLRPDQEFVKDGLMSTMLNTTKEYREALRKGEVSTTIPLFNRWSTGFINGFFGRARN